MVARERQMQICDLLSINNAVQIADLAALFGVSSETIRRDLLALEKGGLLHRTHGGAISLSRMAHGKDYAQRLNERLPQKRWHAARLIGRYNACRLYRNYYIVVVINNVHVYTLAQRGRFVK